MTRIPFTAIAIALAMAAFAEPAAASTALEKKVLTYPMPHSALPSGGPRVKVHYTRIHLNPQGYKAVEELAKGLKQQIALCVGLRRQMKAPANPPSEMLDFALGLHRDTYLANNREITYERRAAFKMNDDCSITGTEHHEAILSSSKGSCRIDLTNKTAAGDCDRTGHADALANPPVPRIGSAEKKAMMERMARDPRTAQYAKQMQALQGKDAGDTGRKKTILGIECDVVTLSGVLASTQCYAHPPAGSAAGDAGAGGILLELKSENGNSEAVEAKLDADVSSAIFVPYAGFKIVAE